MERDYQPGTMGYDHGSGGIAVEGGVVTRGNGTSPSHLQYI